MLNMTYKWFATGLMALMVLVSSGCSLKPTSSSTDPEVDLIAEVQEAAEALMDNATGLHGDAPLLVATFADIDNLQQSSTLGRILSEQFTSSLASNQVPVIEVKMRESLFVKEQTGELILSRKLHSLVQSHDAQAVLLGTYALGGNNVYLTVRLVRTEDNIILAAHDFSLPLNRDIKAMLPRRR
ncbi:FlgO family outer membrane protein [Marinobacterium stanieri]|uniref:FlgO family outer membrane protein n=1 Tax=Marinobacterium stanieri TaxID=49186 RepID=UPI003A8D94BE